MQNHDYVGMAHTDDKMVVYSSNIQYGSTTNRHGPTPRTGSYVYRDKDL